MIYDYKKILKAYLNHIGDQEGTTFLGRSAEPGITGMTPEELTELRRIDAEATEEQLQHKGINDESR